MQLADPITLAGRRLLERYRLDDCIAEGGMSAVWRGTDDRLHRPVSIKIYCAIDPASPKYRAGYDHFLDEVAALARLEHPHTLRIYDVGFLEEEGHPFQVCEWVDGGNLRDHVKMGPLDFPAALALLDPVLGALDEAHEAGLVHADVKPANVLLAEVGAARLAKLADFGIAHRMQRGVPHDTMPDTRDVRLYSPGWAAPEQIRGEAVTPATDVFGAGLLFAFAVTGKRPLPPSELSAIIHDRGDTDAFVRTMLDRLLLPGALRDVLTRACWADPRLRFRNMTELRDALASVSGRVGALRRRDDDATAPSIRIDVTPPKKTFWQRLLRK